MNAILSAASSWKRECFESVLGPFEGYAGGSVIGLFTFDFSMVNTF